MKRGDRAIVDYRGHAFHGCIGTVTRTATIKRTRLVCVEVDGHEVCYPADKVRAVAEAAAS